MPKNFANTQNLVSIKNITQDTVVMKNGGLRQIIMVSGANFALKSEMEQNIITQAYQNFLNGLDFPIQIVVHSRKVNIDKYLEGLSRYETEAMSPLLKNQTEEYREFVRGFVQKNAIMEKTFLLVVSFYPIGIPSAESTGKLFSFLGGKKDKAAETRAKAEALVHLNENLAQLKQRVSQALEGLLSVDLDAVVLNTEQLIELFYNFYNPEMVEREKINLPKQ